MGVLYSIQDCLMDFRKLYLVYNTEDFVKIREIWNIKPKTSLVKKEIIQGDVVKRMYKEITMKA